MSSLDDRERAIRQKLKDDFEHYSSKCLRIRTKAGDVQPFRLNRSQLYLHGRLQAQLEREAPSELRRLHGAAAAWYGAHQRPVPRDVATTAPWRPFAAFQA